MLKYPFRIRIFNNTTGVLETEIPVQTILDFSATKLLNDIGKIAFTFKHKESLVNLFETDTFIQIDVYNNISNEYEHFETYFNRVFHSYYINDVYYYGVGGVSLNDLIDRRILNTQLDSNALNGYVTFGDYAGKILYELANEHMVSSSNAARNFTGLTINPIALGSQIGIREKFTDLLPLFQKVAVSGNVDFEILKTYNTNTLTLDIKVMGTDQSRETNYPNNPYTILSPSLGNLINPSIKIDRTKEKNYIYMTREEDNSVQTALEYFSQQTQDSLYNRIEFSKNLSSKSNDALTFDEIFTEALKELRDNQQKVIFEYEIPQNSKTLNVSMGDKYTVKYGSIEDTLRVEEIELSIEGNNFNKVYKSKVNTNV